MKVQTEIYFKKQELTSNEWKKLIDQISSYHGFLKPWCLFVVLENGKIHYYLETSFPLPINFHFVCLRKQKRKLGKK